MRRIVSRAAGLAPPPVRRALAGAWLDLKDLPARLADPARWADPWQAAHNVGGGDFRAVGQAIFEDLVRYGGLKPEHRVLDIGCGIGRAALPLADWLAPGAGYLGFDVSRSAVEGCRRRFRRRPDFAFVHADIRNGDYSAGGAIAETDYRFPAEDDCFDFAFATSVFSHMRQASVARYLAEAARVLKPGGRLLFTAYGLEAERGTGSFALHSFEGGSLVLDARSPERMIAHPAPVLRDRVADAGLRPIQVLNGNWAPPAAYMGWQDLWVAQKP